MRGPLGENVQQVRICSCVLMFCAVLVLCYTTSLRQFNSLLVAVSPHVQA
jgi:hypothetical protein